MTTRDRSPTPKATQPITAALRGLQERDPGHLERFGPWTEGDSSRDGGQEPHAAERQAVPDQPGPERRALGKMPVRTDTAGYVLAGDDGRPGQDEGQAAR